MDLFTFYKQQYMERDNSGLLVLFNDETYVDCLPITRIVLYPEAVTAETPVIDSTENPTFFEWPVNVESGKYKNKHAIRLMLAGSDLPAGLYCYRLITYDQDNPNGLVWLTPLFIEII